MAIRIDVREHISGPVFDGRAQEAVDRWMEATVRELAGLGQKQIRLVASAMNKSGRGGTGRAAAGVIVYDHGPTQVIFGEMKEGVVWWPWLEGVSRRNDTTQFTGYHTFALTSIGLQHEIVAVAEAKWPQFAPAMGGE